MKSFTESLGLHAYGSQALSPDEKRWLESFANLKLAARGIHTTKQEEANPLLDLGRSLIANFQEKSRLLSDYLCPPDQAIVDFVQAYLGPIYTEVFGEAPCLPTNPLILERHGLARIFSLPCDGDFHQSELLASYRVDQGVCHNPASDRRTTQGVFHVTEGGLPIPDDKRAVPMVTFARMLHAALRPPANLLALPFTANQAQKAEVFVSLLLRPMLSPEVPGICERKTIEVRFFVPGSLVANLDFVESIFGNAGDPFLPENDARLDAEHWSGHTGCVILAPHLVHLTKKALGLPHRSEASERQIRDGMCWEDPEEKYNNGGAFKLTCRDHRGVVVTLIADNYFGYCKKEVKTQLSYAANLYGNVEEEHAGGAIAYPSFDLGESFSLSEFARPVDHTFADALRSLGDRAELQPEGYAIDKTYPDIHYVPENVRLSLYDQTVSWPRTGSEGDPVSLPLQPGITYVLPSGYKVEMVKPNAGQRWRLIGTNAAGTFCHKPCTVSGGGKSEISKPIADAMFTGPVLISDFESVIHRVEEILQRDYSDRYQHRRDPNKASRPILSSTRSLGSVIRLLTPNPEYTDAYNAWLETIPREVRDLVYIIKRFHKPHWTNWKRRFTVDQINGAPGHEVKYRNVKLVTQYLRIGFEVDGSWRTFSLRKDFVPSVKVQTEDDISATVVVPATRLEGLHPELHQFSYKFTQNCEYRLFQRPDDAIIRGYDRKTESDFSTDGNFFSNFEPITRPEATAMAADAIRFEQFTQPMRDRIARFVAQEHPDYIISSAHPRIVDGKPTKNPRYLQVRPDLENPRSAYLGLTASRLFRRLPPDAPLHMPVNAVLCGRRNNPAEPGIRPLAVFNPLHYQELPELFMDFIASLTGKSPSTTGAGSEGALTKGPFNAILPIHDLNAVFVDYLLTGHGGFSSAAGYIGVEGRVDHDISLLIPEVWCRMFVKEREPEHLIANGFMEPVQDFEWKGQTIPASRLGYRITEKFASHYLGRIFSEPLAVFPPEWLRPELQSMEERIAKAYLRDGSVERAVPPLRALIHLMAGEPYQGWDLHTPEFRALFTRESMLGSDWYRARLEAKVKVDRSLAARLLANLEAFASNRIYANELERLRIPERIAAAKARIAECDAPDYVDRLVGCLGADPALVE